MMIDYSNNLQIISKVTPIFSCDLKCEEYVVSEDFFYPLSFLENEYNSVFSCVTDTINDNEIDADKQSSICDASSFQNDEDSVTVCPCVQNIFLLKLRSKIKVRIDAIMFSIIMLELKRSKTFRIKVLKNFFAHYFRENKISAWNNFCIICKKRVAMIHIIVYLSSTKKNILDYKWNGRIQVLVNEKCELENAMAWLSTLGGAFSALGDSFIDCAVKAGAISVQQLHIALRMGDALTICQCKIYLAMSLLQRGYFKRTKKMIRELYKFSTEGEGSKDFRLKNMCIAVWNRMKYLKSQRTIKHVNIN